MRRIALTLAALAVAASSVPLNAQTGAATEAETAFQCAIWASYFSAEYEGQPEADALAYALNYFVGRYEGLTGHGIDRDIDAELVTKTANTLDVLTPLCTSQMEGFGTRMAEWGKALQEIGAKIPADEQQT